MRLPELFHIVKFKVNLFLDSLVLQALMILRKLYIDLPLLLQRNVVLACFRLLLLVKVLDLDLLDALVGIL